MMESALFYRRLGEPISQEPNSNGEGETDRTWSEPCDFRNDPEASRVPGEDYHFHLPGFDGSDRSIEAGMRNVMRSNQAR